MNFISLFSMMNLSGFIVVERAFGLTLSAIIEKIDIFSLEIAQWRQQKHWPRFIYNGCTNKSFICASYWKLLPNIPQQTFHLIEKAKKKTTTILNFEGREWIQSMVRKYKWEKYLFNKLFIIYFRSNRSYAWVVGQQFFSFSPLFTRSTVQFYQTNPNKP